MQKAGFLITRLIYKAVVPCTENKDVVHFRQYRLMAYSQFINWVRRGQLLGKKFRVVIPACVVLKIRKAFPEPSGEYEGYHSASDSDSDLD